MKDYREEDFLMLSGIQHYAFCPRQWALIHIEQQWKENYFTIDGNILHENAHNGEMTEKRKNILITRGMPVFSRTLGISGNCDVVEFHAVEGGITLQNYEGRYNVVPIEYKRGKPKEHDADVLQLCAQAICLEEMLVCEIEKGYLYYGETRRRLEVLFDKEIRKRVTDSFMKMHEYYERRHTPKAKPTKACQSCSLSEICLPKLSKISSVKTYMENNLKET
ncbi:CRISPR-associated Cas4 family exonuclease [Kineothrix alysoides]|uniref:CRISPR-associated exonuclease Cas4 n=1 Tax=Kineothrix alysoides TaxID=1469948 RepID=A0A4V2QBD0_9FIRM|nr:CRISPR-associated protein Cas4 [Kineothrix alysoides]TCL55902.1 CRISPR-associated Cas4 family exonuclease [Kineothrix alysoides]